ncbi:MAG: SsrA-binding protein SmpB [Actinobacteria bacterium]|nr:SsrA-binding protein SmpB [Actinomycetota bacterium]
MNSNSKDAAKTLIAQNKKAFKDFFILDRYEAGIVLEGCEVKSVRERKINLKDSYARIKNSEIFVHNIHISPYINSRTEEIKPARVRKLLLHRREINKIENKLKDKSLTLVPLSIYITGSMVKVELALAKGKLKSDKRRDIEKKESELEVRRALKNRGKKSF